ncbi:MAG: four helix bundle protein [Acidobacteriia bacterium]|nr:four helix bundle protein [Terriglobia bacterium]
MAQHYKDLIAWQKAMDLVSEVYAVTDCFPKREVYSLTDQIRRAAVSIPSNIAEGQAHFNNGEFMHFLRHARGSLAELETQVLIAHRQEYATDSQLQGLVKQINEVNRILSGLINSLTSRKSIQATR